jgi:hypothetical protein
MMSGVAQARDPAGAEALFRAGREALRRGDYAAACRAFEGSQRLDPAGGTALNLAECEQGRGRVASAWQHTREALDLLPPDDDRIPLARRHLEDLEHRLPHLTVRLAPGAPPGTKVTRDDVEVTGALLGFAQPLDPGHHVVRVSAPGRAARSYDVDAAEGRAGDLVVEAGDPLPSRDDSPRLVDPSKPRGISARTRAGLIVGGFGLAATGVGVAEGLAVIARGNEKTRLCPGNVCPDAAHAAIARDLDSSGKTLSVVSTVACGVGLAALATSAVLVLTGSSRENAPAITVAPEASREGVSLGVGGSF